MPSRNQSSLSVHRSTKSLNTISRIIDLTQRAQSGQAFVEFAMVLILIVTILTGGLLVIRALFLQQSLLDVATRAIQWGSSTNSNEEMQRIIDEAKNFAPNVIVIMDPPNADQRPIGTLFTLTLRANIPLVGPTIALTAPLSARVAAIIQHNPMRFVAPTSPPFNLQVGDYTRVFTTAGDNLNVRRKPGLDGDVAFILHPNTQVQIVGGPVDANGLRWYKVYLLHSKLTGWCVGRADQVDTLIKIGRVF